MVKSRGTGHLLGDCVFQISTTHSRLTTRVRVILGDTMMWMGEISESPILSYRSTMADTERMSTVIGEQYQITIPKIKAIQATLSGLFGVWHLDIIVFIYV